MDMDLLFLPIELFEESPISIVVTLSFLVASAACMLAVPSHRVKLALVFVLGLGLRLLVALHDPLSLQDWPLTDDSYYYFNIARNFAHGDGLRHDSFHITTGFQPLFLFLISPVYWLVSDRQAAITGVLIVQIGIGVLLGAALYRFAKLLGGAQAGLLAAAIWAVSPFFLRADLSGLETNLSLLMVVLTLTFYLKRFVYGTAATSSTYAVLGLLCGVSFLARVDSGLLAPVLLADILRRELGARPIGEILRNAALMTIAALVPVLPWAVYNVVVIGSVLPSSGQAVRFISQAYGYYFLGGESAGDGSFEIGSPSVAYYKTTLWYALKAIRKVISDVFPVWAGVILIGSASIFGLRRLASSVGRTAFVFAFLLGLYLAYSFYIFGHWFFYRYFAAFAIGYLIVLALALVETKTLPMVGRLRWPLRHCGKVLFPLALSSLLFSSLKKIENIHTDPQPSDFYHAAVWINENTPKDAVIGAFQTGIFGYYLDRKFYGLDGKINQDALEAMKTGTIDRYVDDKRIDYLMDWPWILEYLFINRSTDPEYLERKDLIREDPFSVYRLR